MRTAKFFSASPARPPAKTRIPAGIDAEGGSAKRDPDVPQIALFEITGKFAPGSPTDGTPNPPYGNWYSARRRRSSTIPPAKWSTPRDAGDEDTVPLEVSVWHNAGYQIDSTDPDRAMPDGLAAAYQFMPAAGPGQWVWCFLDETVGLWVMLQPFEDIIRVQLAEDWYACDSAAANILIALGDADEWLGFATGYAVTVYDPLGAIANDLLAVSDSSGNWYMPAGTCAIVKRFADDNAWEPLRFMPGQCPTSSSSSSSSGSSGSRLGQQRFVQRDRIFRLRQRGRRRVRLPNALSCLRRQRGARRGRLRGFTGQYRRRQRVQQRHLVFRPGCQRHVVVADRLPGARQQQWQ